METILIECSEDNGMVCSVAIIDIDGGAATLYVLNGGTSLPTPNVGNFAYDFSTCTFQVFYSNGWIAIPISALDSGVSHPKGNKSSVSFTASALPFWMPFRRNVIQPRPCPFKNMEMLLSHFRGTYDPSNIRRSLSEDGIMQSAEGRKRKTVQVTEGAGDETTTTRFPKDVEMVKWHAGFETYLPFVGRRRKEGEEGLIVKDLAQRVSLERSGDSGLELCDSDPESFRVRDLVAEVELDDVLRRPGEHDPDVVEEAFARILVEINSRLGQSTLVVVWSLDPGLRLRFSKPSVALHCGDLGQRCHWLDGVLYSMQEPGSDPIEVHRTTTMEDFLDMANDPSVCGNFLDGKDLVPNPPTWTRPSFDSTTAWNQTIHLKFGKKSKEEEVTIEEAQPSFINSQTWTSQGWRLMTHSG
ncbi:hypothetical protein PAXRUDRAFT_29162, partial [Paxillus rubicundulus Ve08.2h10]